MKNILRLAIRFYQLFLSPLLGGQCRFYPTCSAYLHATLTKYPLRKALWQGMRRILRCHPWGLGGVDLP